MQIDGWTDAHIRSVSVLTYVLLCVVPRYTPLMEAAREGHEHVVRLLMESGEEREGEGGGGEGRREREKGEREGA